jgi:predicted phosphodiesterase
LGSGRVTQPRKRPFFMNALIISDLHLTESIHEEYRWMVFNSARQYLKEHKIPHLFILGDLLDKKDRHPAELVNRLIKELVRCTDAGGVHLTILKGNHDYLKPEHPYLDFLYHVEHITWVNKPQFIINDLKSTLWLPHSKTPETEWEKIDFKDADYIFMHQSVIGCKVSNMFEMNHGLNLKWLTSRTNAKIYSGDIHVPQKIGALTYIGTQHPVSFGDDYQPRMLWLNGKEEISIDVQSIKRLVLKITTTKDLERLKNNKQLVKGDQVKVKVLLGLKELSNWTETKQLVKEWCEYNEIELFDVTLERLEDLSIENQTKTIHKFDTINPQIAFKNFVQAEKLDPFLIQIGQELLDLAAQNKGV